MVKVLIALTRPELSEATLTVYGKAVAESRFRLTPAITFESEFAPTAVVDRYVERVPMGRLGTAEEVADVIVFTASPRAHWINGRNIGVDGLEQPYPPVDRRPF